MTRLPCYITLEKAKAITGHESDKAWRNWLNRWNHANHDHMVIVRPGYVERGSLLDALDAQARAHTPGMKDAAVMLEMHLRQIKRNARRKAA